MGCATDADVVMPSVLRELTCATTPSGQAADDAFDSALKLADLRRQASSHMPKVLSRVPKHRYVKLLVVSLGNMQQEVVCLLVVRLNRLQHAAPKRFLCTIERMHRSRDPLPAASCKA